MLALHGYNIKIMQTFTIKLLVAEIVCLINNLFEIYEYRTNVNFFAYFTNYGMLGMFQNAITANADMI